MSATNIVILTGAGISAESGVSTFRDPDGVWARRDYRAVATPEGFAADPRLVHEFYNARRRGLRAVDPNAAHYALAKLEEALAARGGRVTLVTQNVDNLHARAGSKNILAMHGELAKSRCGKCGDIALHDGDLSIETECRSCGRAGAMRPHVVWFGETPFFMDEIAEAMAGADLFVSIGTSGVVYPAAGFVAQARALGAPAIEMNLEPSENACLFTDGRYGKAGEVVPAWVDEILGET